MEKQVLVNESSLVNIAEALRDRLGDTYLEFGTSIQNTPIVKVSKTTNAIGFDTYSGSYGSSTNTFDVVTIEGASLLKVRMAYQTEGTNYDWVQVAPGSLSSSPSTTTYPKYGGTTRTEIDLEFAETDTITFYFRSDSSNGTYLGYYAEIRGYDAEGNIIEESKEVVTSIERNRVFTPSAMSNAINEIPSGNWEKRINNTGSYAGESAPLKAEMDTANQQVIYDLSSKVKPGDCNWLFGTYCGSNSTSTKYLLMINLLTTQIPSGATEEIEIDRFGVYWWQYGDSGSALNASPLAVFPNALYIKAYYNPATCKLRIDCSAQLNSSNFTSRVDSYGQLIYRIVEE